jgi:alpha-methylacyl-CoA racemase
MHVIAAMFDHTVDLTVIDCAQGLGLDVDALPAQLDRDEWPSLTKVFESTFKSKTRAEWRAIFDGTDACVTPVLELDEVAQEPNTKQRNLMMTEMCGYET